jgi:hypothetical protein
VYGVLAAIPLPPLTESPWRMAPQRIYRPQHFLLWPAGASECWIDSVDVRGESCIMGPVPARLFEPESSIADFAEFCFDPPIELHGENERGLHRRHLIGVPLVARPETDLGQLYGFPTLEVGQELTIHFRGALRGLVLAGEELYP